MTAVAMPALARSLAAPNATVPWCTYRLGLPPTAALTDVTGPAALAGGAWLSCADVLDDAEFFTRWNHSLSTRMADTYSTVPPVTPAGYVMSWYAGMVGYLGGMLFHHERRVPVLAPERLAFTVSASHCRPTQVALLDESFHCLPGDRDADSPHATVVADDAALAEVLRTRVIEHGERFVAAFRRASRFGPHMLWGAVTDALDRGLWHLAHQRGDDPAGAADAALVLPGGARPFTSASTIHTVGGASGVRHWTRTRQSCCFYYKLPGVGDPCVTCPRLDDAQRARLLDDQN